MNFVVTPLRYFALTLYLVRKSIFEFTLNIHPTVMNVAQRGEKNRDLWRLSIWNFLLGSKFLRKATRVLLSLNEI